MTAPPLVGCVVWSRGALDYVFVGFWDRDYVSQLPCVKYYVFVKNSFKYTREECESKRAYVKVPGI